MMEVLLYGRRGNTTLRTQALDQFLFPFPSPTIIWLGMSGILLHIPLLLRPRHYCFHWWGKKEGRKSPLTSSSSGAKSRGKNFNWSSSSLAEEVCVKEGWKKKEEKESLFMGVSQKKVLSPFLFRAGASTTSFIK